MWFLRTKKNTVHPKKVSISDCIQISVIITIKRNDRVYFVIFKCEKQTREQAKVLCVMFFKVKKWVKSLHLKSAH